MAHTQPIGKVWGLVPAGGSGSRFGGDTPKQFLDIGGKAAVEWALERLLESGLAGLTVALPEPWLPIWRERLEALGAVGCVVGGGSRQESVAACLEACPADAELVVVHDAARPAVAVSDIRATIAAARVVDGAILGRPMVDTIKQIEDGRVVGTVDRGTLLRAETPQVFRRAALATALERCRQDGFVGTDEASIVERLEGIRIHSVLATRRNPKLTEPQDRALLELLLLGEEESR